MKDEGGRMDEWVCECVGGCVHFPTPTPQFGGFEMLMILAGIGAYVLLVLAFLSVFSGRRRMMSSRDYGTYGRQFDGRSR